MQKNYVDSDSKSWDIKWFNMGAKDRFGYPEYSLPVVPHKAVAEVSKIGNL